MKQSVGLPNDLAGQMIDINLMHICTCVYFNMYVYQLCTKVEFSSPNMFNQISEAEACGVAPCL